MHYRRGKTRVIFTENFALYLGDYAVTGEEKQQERRKEERKKNLICDNRQADLTYDGPMIYRSLILCTIYYTIYHA